MGRSTRTRQERREVPAERPIALPAAAEANEAEEKNIAETRTVAGALSKQKKGKQTTRTQSKRQRDKAVKAAEFAERLEAKATKNTTKKAKKESAKRLWA